MLIPKANHLVERVTERLLRSGALDDSSAQLLGRPSGTVAEESMSPPNQSTMNTQRLALIAARSYRAERGPVSALQAVPDGQAYDSDMASNVSPVGESDLGDAVDHTGSTPAAPKQEQFVPRSAEAAVAGSGIAHGQPVADWPAALPQGPSCLDAISLERAGMIDWSRTRTRISEEFRLVQRQILRSAFGPGSEPGFSNLLLVTSARPGEGKSFMSTNLAGSIARQGDHHVLLVDADSKRDSICYSLGLGQSRGILDLAANPELDPGPLIVKTPIERLSILPVGRERERSAELFSTKDMTRLIQSLGRRYADRLLILDAPPCLSTSDPAVLAQVVGQILFVVEASRTQRDEIEASLDLIQACPTITMVLNKQQMSSRYTFGAYSSYYSS